MPCPYFEPQRITARSEGASALAFRLPLIEEYDGVCRAAVEPFAAPDELRFQLCNHGNCAGRCAHFPANAACSSQRFNMTGSSSTSLEVLQLQETSYAPTAWRSVRYFIGSELLEPEISDVCARAQLIAFCRSFLRHFEPHL